MGVNLSNNLLRTLPDSIGQLHILGNLDLSNNKICILPDSFGLLQYLYELNLSKNNFLTFPDPVSNLKNLEKLNLNRNYLTTFPKAIDQLSELRELYLSNNEFSSLSDSLKLANSLKVLSLVNNPIELVNIDSLPPNLDILIIEDEKLRGDVDGIFTPVEQCFVKISGKMSFDLFLLEIRRIINEHKIKVLVTPEDLQRYVQHDALAKHGLIPQKSSSAVEQIRENSSHKERSTRKQALEDITNWASNV